MRSLQRFNVRSSACGNRKVSRSKAVANDVPHLYLRLCSTYAYGFCLCSLRLGPQEPGCNAVDVGTKPEQIKFATYVPQSLLRLISRTCLR